MNTTMIYMVKINGDEHQRKKLKEFGL